MYRKATVINLIILQPAPFIFDFRRENSGKYSAVLLEIAFCIKPNPRHNAEITVNLLALNKFDQGLSAPANKVIRHQTLRAPIP